MILHKSFDFKVIWTNLKCELNLGKKSKKSKINKMNCNVKQTFFKKLKRKIWRFSIHVEDKSLIFVVEKN